MINKAPKIAGIILFVFGILLLIHSISYEVYTNENEYQNEYMQLNDGKGDSENFYQLRKTYLTPKFKLEDYGITCIIVGLATMAVSLIGVKQLKTPRKKFWIIMIGIFAALLTNAAYVCDLFLEMYRDGFPHWADSLGIPLMGVPFLIFLALTWVAINSIGMRNDFKTDVLLFPISLDKQNIWYLIILFLTIVYTLFTIIDGYFWQVLPGFLWIYFYSSIMIGIKEAKLVRQ